MHDTQREFSVYLEASRETEVKVSSGDADVIDDFNMDDMGTYSPEELPVVESALELMTKQKAVVRAGLSCINEVAEKVSGLPEQPELKRMCFQWVANSVDGAKIIESVVIDLGAELYSPIDEESVNEHKECNISHLIGFGQKIIHPGFDVSLIFGANLLTEQYHKDIELIKSLLLI